MRILVLDNTIDLNDDMELIIGFQAFYNNKMSKPNTMKNILDTAESTQLSRRTTLFKIKNSK